ncbi:excisionase family DNA binding protein [Arthrobacter ginsengisoli]|uniref:Excisionase family DNA binding protein n=1 Tax=Arthrobacter ginsengisoli TaxID=1356565 RepID=A0ABU1UIM0_9MICC|nr:helix-turn-helix domain-containing protein [Arthrobacter ginsengisoli]MDR7085027.1 excisionase family DNA binding protein [Arthrobacter ginsengisoli]
MPLANVPTPYLTIAEVAEGLRVSKMTVYRLVRTHALASMRFGKSYRISEQAVEDYLGRTSVSAEPCAASSLDFPTDF